MNAAQRAEFERLTAMLPPAPRSLANSGGVFLGPDYHYDLVRPGIVLYGGRAHEKRPNPMRTVVRLSAKVLQVFEVPPGQTVGYNATYVIDKPTRVATIACGYADGLLRGGSNRLRVELRGKVVPVVGRITMDMTMLAVPAGAAALGDIVTFFGGRVSLADHAEAMGTNAYESLTAIGSRVPRIYR